MTGFLGYLLACWLDQRNGRDIGQGIPDYPNTETTMDTPRNYPTFPGVTDTDRQQQSIRQAASRIEDDLAKLGTSKPNPNKDRDPQRYDFLSAASVLRGFIETGAAADWFGDEVDPEPWFTFACWVAETEQVEQGDSDVFVLDLSKCGLADECGPCCGGHVIVGDCEMLVTLVMYAAPHTTDGRALALYQVEVL